MIHRLIIYWHRIKTYIKEVKNFNRLYPKNYSLLEMALFFWPWFYSLRFGASPLQDEIPWMTFKSIEFLKSKLKKNMRIFEYGSGGSTIFWGRHGCETVSVEHDQNWYNLVQSEIHKKKLYSCRLLLRTADANASDEVYSAENVQRCLSEDGNYNNKNFYRYVHSIDDYPDRYFDFIVIDGRARNSCFLNAVKKIKIGGYIIWDNTDRESYLWLVNKNYDNLEFIDLPGPSPYSEFFTRTCAWKKIKDVDDHEIA